MGDILFFSPATADRRLYFKLLENNAINYLIRLSIEGNCSGIHHFVVLTLVFSWKGTIFNYRMWGNVFWMSSTWPAFPSELPYSILVLPNPGMSVAGRCPTLINPKERNLTGVRGSSIHLKFVKDQLEPSTPRTASERLYHSPTELQHLYRKYMFFLAVADKLLTDMKERFWW